MSELIISVSGLRGVVGETLTAEVAARYAASFATTVQEQTDGPFVVTRDSRPSGGMLADAIHAALNGMGRNTLDGGIAATPTTGILIREFNAAGGIQISASHNPIEFNGMKLFDATGRVIPKEVGAAVLQRYRDRNLNETSGTETTGTRTLIPNIAEKHLQAILRTVDTTAIRACRFHVLLDANHGAGALLGRPLLEALNCDVTILGEEPNGQFLHTPEPTAENLTTVCETVKTLGVDVAFCQDPDADRLAVIDGQGRYIGEEYTVVLCLEHILRMTENPNHPFSRKKGPMVVNCATSRMSDDVAAKYGIKIFRSAVGEANVVDLMHEKDAMFGGEGNGGPIDPAVGFVRDSFVGMAQILDCLAATGKTVAELVAEIPSYALVKRKVEVPSNAVPKLLDQVAEKFRHWPCDRLDGLRIDHGDAWVLLRGSNTEPIIRVFAEAPDAERANQLCDEVENVLGR